MSSTQSVLDVQNSLKDFWKVNDSLVSKLFTVNKETINTPCFFLTRVSTYGT